ncbi:MAG: hypothetical protein WCK05_06020 [Planctomycetota bacterium]
MNVLATQCLSLVLVVVASATAMRAAGVAGLLRKRQTTGEE